MTNENEVQETEVQETEVKSKKRIKKRYGLTIVGIFLAVVASYVFYEAYMFQTTDDAYIETTTVQVSPKVAGQVTASYVEDNQFVKKGDLVAKIDDADYKIKLEQAQARYERALLNQKNAKAGFVAADSTVAAAKKDFERYTALYEKGAVSKQALDDTKAKYDSALANLTAAEQSLFSENQSKVADAELKELKALRDQAQLNLNYTKVLAPQDGTVSNRRVEAGMYVQVGSPLFVIVPEKIWIVANYKESQVGKMRKGQDVEITVDAYHKKVFKGTVDSIQRSSGAKSSLFPPENAVGSFVKIVQRIPVKIVFDEEIDKDLYNLVPGMSVIPKVRVR